MRKLLSYPKQKMNVLLLENIDPTAVSTFLNQGYHVESISHALEEEELREKIKEISILGIRSKTEVTKTIIDSAPKLLTIGTFCIGVNQIDLKAASRKGIAVFNAPYSNTRSVVELVVGEIIMLSRVATDKSVKLHNGIWDKSSKGAHEIRGKTLGIIGYGNIGAQLSVLAENLGMHVYFYNTSEKLALGNAKKCSSLEEVLKVSDIVTIHVDGRNSNTNLISEKEFKMMKEGVIFLNLSRGHVVDVEALVQYIKNGKISGAAVDVFPQEPRSNGEKFISPLQGLPNVILTPHIGGSTEEAQKNIGEFVSSKLTNFIDSGDSMLSINIPNIQLPILEKAHRFLHIHHNIPGVLAKVNSVLGESKLNIAGQYLGTTSDIGYVITDVDKNYNKEVLNKLKTIPETLKFRVLY